MKLIIVHYHWRPGGIRRVIELATPQLLRQFRGTIHRVVLAGGEAPPRDWGRHFRRQLGGTPVECFTDSSFGYLSEQAGDAPALQTALVRAMKRLLSGATGQDCAVWFHNPAVGRNLLLTRALTQACAARGVPLLAHHHDWWFDNRWLRWPEMRRFGFRTLRRVAETTFPADHHVRHLAINQADARLLHRHFPKHSGWLPNLMERQREPPARRVQAARDWLRRHLKIAGAPVWIMPCRLLRRKNIAEALLLKGWLRPDAWLITTGGVSSADEQGYADDLRAAAHAHRWRLRLGVLQGDESNKPSVAELVAASEVVVLTSVQEGFGLPYLEAAAARRPLIARAVPNITPDLAKFGFRFPQLYDEILIDPRLFDWTQEQRRQQRLFRQWRRHLPGAWARRVGCPTFLALGDSPVAVPFSRLTLTAQIEVLAQPRERSWDLCRPLNPFLAVWRRRAEEGNFQRTHWPRQADDWLSGHAYARRFAEVLKSAPQRPPARATAFAAQEQFIRERLGADHLFPLLWSRES